MLDIGVYSIVYAKGMSKSTESEQVETIEVQCADGVRLSGRLYLPEGAMRALVMINPATAARTSYYYPFAEFLRTQGFGVCCWNYRGMDGSGQDSLKGCAYQFTDVGKLDIPAVIDFLKARFAGVPLLCIGHSVGAQQVGLVANNHLLDGLIAVATSVGYPPFMPLGYRLQTHFFFQIFAPLSILLKGYVAAARFGIMEDLPRDVALQWKAWCYRPDYLFDRRFYGRPEAYGGVVRGNCQALPFPVAVFTATDDEISTRQAVSRFWQHQQSTAGKIRFSWYSPRELGQPQIKHFGYFRKTFKDTLWQDLLQTLEGFLAHKAEASFN